MNFNKDNSIIIYFSRADENYFAGGLRMLEKGNTEILAQKLSTYIGCKSLKVERTTPYPQDYQTTTEVAKKEHEENACPHILTKIPNLSQYEYIFIGYPNWWGTLPMPMWTFLEKGDFSDKTIIPFCTHEGSGLGNSLHDLQKLCPQSKMMTGFAICGSKVEQADKTIEEWIANID